jgi:hypothetical protein
LSHLCAYPRVELQDRFVIRFGIRGPARPSPRTRIRNRGVPQLLKGSPGAKKIMQIQPRSHQPSKFQSTSTPHRRGSFDCDRTYRKRLNRSIMPRLNGLPWCYLSFFCSASKDNKPPPRSVRTNQTSHTLITIGLEQEELQDKTCLPFSAKRIKQSIKESSSLEQRSPECQPFAIQE